MIPSAAPYLKRACLLFFLVFLLASSCSKEPEFLPGTVEYNEEPAFFLRNPYEKEVTAQISEIGRNLGVAKIPVEDPALSAAARNIAMTVKKADLDQISRFDNETLKKKMEELGVTDNAFRSLLFNVAKAKDAQAQIETNLGADLKISRFTHFGVGVARNFWPPTLIVAVLMTRRPVELNPFPRTVLLNQTATVSGRVIWQGDSVTVIVQNSKDTLTTHPPILSGSYFTQDILFSRGGVHTIEVMLESDRGPEVAALFTTKVEGSGEEQAASPTERRPVNSVQEARDRLLELVNKERYDRNLLPLTMDEKINKIAQNYAEEMNKTGEVTHVSLKSGDCADRAKAEGLKFQRITENIAVNQSIEQIHESLMGSPSHRENILDPQVEWAGFGVVFTKNNTQIFVVENFIKYWKNSK